MGVAARAPRDSFNVEELKGMLLRATVTGSSKGSFGGPQGGAHSGYRQQGDDRTVCVTSATSFVGFAIVGRLLSRGYAVRLAVESQENLEKLREMEVFGGMARDDLGTVVVVDMTDLDGLCEAFDGCSCVFHTSAFADPNGVSGYTKHMADIESVIADRVIEACTRTQSVRKCVFTSSLVACIWRQDSLQQRRLPTIVDENCWSDESLCRDKKLWFALGKTMAEKAAWRAAWGKDVKLVTLCPALITGPGFRRRNSTASIAYLKGAQQMLSEGSLATIDVSKVAEAHVAVFEAMGSTACGRYVCFDHVVRRVEEVDALERQLGIPSRISIEVSSLDQSQAWFELSKRKISRLMSSRMRCSYDMFSSLS